MLELEKIAFNKGYTFAVAFVNDACRLCENAM
jgi:predicted metal-binding protein